MIANLTALTLAVLFTMLPVKPSEPDPMEHAAAREGDVLRIINRRMTVDGREYAWSVIVPRGVQAGGAGLLFLHGYGECGDDGMRQLAVGLPPALGRDPERWPFVVIAPQKPVANSEWEDHEKAVLAMLDQVVEEGLIDPARLVITGLSQGGHGTIAFASRHPERFKAAAPVCGYVEPRFKGDGVRAANTPATPEAPLVLKAAHDLSDMPVWMYHGDRDSAVPVDESKSLFAALGSGSAGDVHLTVVPNTDHNSWDAAYADSALSAWLIAHAR